jgi:peptide/nickel transport system ATP-binding protein
MSSLLNVNNLKTYFHTSAGLYKAVDGVSFEIEKGKTLGLVGESGCGKSVTALSIMRLIDEPGKIEGGEILFNGQDLTKFTDKEMQKIRGDRISMIFQEPMTSLNPVYRCGYQISEAILAHRKVTKDEANKRAIELMNYTGIPSAEQRYSEYPHQLSGGLRQRVMIAMALACDPDILIADEPTTALDVTTQVQIIDLLKKLQQELGMAILIITHDFGVIADIARTVAVMYASKIVEVADADEIFKNPKHPYTIGLLKSLPQFGKRKEKLPVIKGSVPSPLEYPAGCHFCTRCELADEKCITDEPPLIEISSEHKAACWKI